MAPDPPHTAVFKRNKDTYSQHAGFPLDIFIGQIQKSTESSIALMDEVSIPLFSSRLAAGHVLAAYTKSSSTL